MKTALVLTGALMMLGVSALELPYVSDFGKTDRDVSAVVENGCIVSGGKYNFAVLNLPVSDSNLEVAISVSGRDGAQFGAGLYDAAVKKRLLLPVWAKKTGAAEKLLFIIPAEKLKEPAKLLLYNTARKGTLAISSIRIAKTEKSASAENASRKGAACVTIPFKSDFSGKQEGFSAWNNIVNGKLNSGAKYAFAALNVPASGEPLSCSLTVTAEGGAALGAIVYELQANGLPGKRIRILGQNMIPGHPRQNVDLAIPASDKPQIIMFYNNAKKGSLIVDDILLEKMQ